MSYQVLARKWRPNNFSELVGQEHVVAAISNALDNDRLHHAYLFTGTRGVGKTTIARIFSKSLNCDQGMGSKPCGQCGTCKEIEQGNYVDLLEIDAASRTKVEDTRELLDNVQYRPTRGRFKVYLIDEVHMLSKHSFNALLKTLEEPPPHVKFLLATTDPQKLPITILSRCLQFNLKALSRTQIAKQLDYIFKQEQINSEPEAISQLSRAAQGSMRDALSLSDQAVAQGNGQVSLSIVTDMLGLMDKNQVLKLLNSVLQKDSQAVFMGVDKMAEQAPNYAQILSEIMSLLHQVALTQFVPEACKLETISARAIFELAKKVAPEQIQLLYQIALQGKKDLPFAADAKTGLEMTLLRMLAFCPANISMSIDDLVEQTPAGKVELHKPQVEHSLNSHKTRDPVTHLELNEGIHSDPVAVGISPTREQPAIFEPPIGNSTTQVSANEQLPVSGLKTLDDYNQQDDFEQQQDLIAQQQQIMQEAEDFVTTVNPDYDLQIAASQSIGSDLAEEITSSSRSEQSNSDRGSVNATESLLALKRKLQQAQIDQEEQSPSVKKSEQNFDHSSFLPGASGSAMHQPVRQDSQPIASNALENKNQPVHSDGSPASSLQPLVGQAIEADETPPWSTDVDHVSQINVAVEKQPLVSSTPEELTEALFDPTAHLDQDIDCQVDYNVPAFLENGDKVTSAQQLDSWSQLIAQMQVAALTKQLALHSEFSQQGDTITLNLFDSKQHLNTESARAQLQQALSEVLQRDIKIEIIVNQAINTPFALQQTINKVRLDYAFQVVQSDPNINRLKDTFAAQVVTDTIKPR